VAEEMGASVSQDPLTWPEESRKRAPGRRGTVVRWVALLVAVAAVIAGVVFGSRLDADPGLVRTPLIGTTVTDSELPALEGGVPLRLSDLRGQVVVVNFWASWCVACREEHAALLSVAETYRAAGVTFVGIVYQDEPDAAVGFLDEMGRGGESYRYVTDPGSAAALDFGVFGVPETFVIDRDGIIRGKITGASTFPLLAGAVDEVLAGRVPQSRVSGSVQPGRGEPYVDSE
jgi:cytochrome c biogenesis protein CcmG/thiol:disulfide interchange protein DsbE